MLPLCGEGKEPRLIQYTIIFVTDCEFQEECDVDPFDAFFRTYSPGGERQLTSTDTLEECKAVCRNTLGCHGFDYAYQHRRCDLHYNQDFANSGRGVSQLNQYRRVNCSGNMMFISET